MESAGLPVRAHRRSDLGRPAAVYAGLTQEHRDESRAQGLDRLGLIRFLQVAQAIAVHHGVLAHLLRIKALRASEPLLGPDVLLWRVWDH